MSYAEWIKKKRGVEPRSTPSSEATPKAASTTLGASKSISSYADWIRDKKGSTSLSAWVNAANDFVVNVKGNAYKWHDKSAYQPRYEQSQKLLGQADRWRKQYSGNDEAIAYINSVVDAVSSAQGAAFSSHQLLSKFDNEVSYNQWQQQQEINSMSADEYLVKLYEISDAKSDLDLIQKVNLTICPVDGYGENATIDEQKKYEDYIANLTTLWEKYGQDEYDTVEDFYYGEFYTNAGKRLVKAAEDRSTGVAYTTADGKNVTWQALYDHAAAKQDLSQKLDMYSTNSDWDEKSKGIDVSSDPNRQSDYNIVFELSRTNVAYDKETALANGTSEADWEETDKKRRYIGNKYGVDLYSDIYDNVLIFGEIMALLDDRSWESGELFTQLHEDVVGDRTFKNMHHLTDDEKKVLNYIFYTQGRDAALQWHNSRMHIYQDRANGVLVEEMSDWGKKSPGGLLAFVSPQSLASVALRVGSGFEQAGDWITGDNNNILARASSATRSGVMETTDWEIGNWDAFDFIYSNTMSAADTVVASAMPGKTGSVVLGLSTAAQATNDAMDRGFDKKHAFLNGVAAGVFETLFESWSIGNFNALQAVASVNGRDIAWNIAKSMFVNASEELLTEVANIVYDDIVNGDFSQYETAIRQYIAYGFTEEEAKRKAALDLGAQVGEAGAGGAFMGFGFGSIGSVGAIKSNISSTLHNNAKISRVYGADPGALVDETLEINPDNGFAQKMQAKLDSGKQLSVGQLNRLVQQNEVALTAQDISKIQSAAEARLTELGETGDVTAIAAALAKRFSGEKLTNKEYKLIQDSKYGRRVSAEMNPANIRSGGYASAWAENIGTERINIEEYNRLVEAAQLPQQGMDVTWDQIATNVPNMVQEVAAVDTSRQTDYDITTSQGGQGYGEGEISYRYDRGLSEGDGPERRAQSEGNGAQNDRVLFKQRISERASRATLYDQGDRKNGSGVAYRTDFDHYDGSSAKDNEGNTLPPDVAVQLKDTAVVDFRGRPMKVYHGTPNMTFVSFTKGDAGFHFGTLEQAQKRLQDKNTGQGRIIHGYIIIRNPVFSETDIGRWDAEPLSMFLVSNGYITDAEYAQVQGLLTGDCSVDSQYDAPAAIHLREILESKGYDGVIYSNFFEGDALSYMVFRDNQFIRTGASEHSTSSDTATQTDYDITTSQRGETNATVQRRSVHTGRVRRNTQDNSEGKTARGTKDGRRNVQPSHQIRLHREDGEKTLHTTDSEGRSLTTDQISALQGTTITEVNGSPLAVYLPKGQSGGLPVADADFSAAEYGRAIQGGETVGNVANRQIDNDSGSGENVSTPTTRQALEQAIGNMDSRSMDPKTYNALFSYNNKLQHANTTQKLLDQKQDILQQQKASNASDAEIQRTQADIAKLENMLAQQEQKLSQAEEDPILQAAAEKASAEIVENSRKKEVDISRTFDRIKAESVAAQDTATQEQTVAEQHNVLTTEELLDRINEFVDVQSLHGYQEKALNAYNQQKQLISELEASRQTHPTPTDLDSQIAKAKDKLLRIEGHPGIVSAVNKAKCRIYNKYQKTTQQLFELNEQLEERKARQKEQHIELERLKCSETDSTDIQRIQILSRIAELEVEIAQIINQLHSIEEKLATEKALASAIMDPADRSALLLDESQTTIVNGKRVVIVKNLFDPGLIDKKGRTNLQRIAMGLSPCGFDGKPLNIHHLDQTDDGMVVAIPASLHQKYDSMLHLNTGTSPSQINRSVFGKWKKSYWKWVSQQFFEQTEDSYEL